MAQPQLPGVGALVQGVHDLREVLVDVDVELLQGGEVVELRVVGDGELLHTNVELLIRDLRGNNVNIIKQLAVFLLYILSTVHVTEEDYQNIVPG